MGKIGDVYYEEISDQLMSVDKAADFYYLYNLMNLSEDLREEYEKYEQHQLSLRNTILGRAYNNNEGRKIPRHPKMGSSILGVSSMKNRVVLITEY